jgi:hypothetical protein
MGAGDEQASTSTIGDRDEFDGVLARQHLLM